MISVAGMRRGDFIFSVQAAESGNDLGYDNAGQADFAGLVAPRQYRIGAGFMDIAFNKRRGIEKNTHWQAQITNRFRAAQESFG